MFIYIDESGNFSNPNSNEEATSCVGALVIPDTQRRTIFKQFKRIKNKWGIKSDEIKGSKLNEEQSSQIISMLLQYDALFFPVIHESGGVSDEEVTLHKFDMAKSLVKNITSKHNETLVANVYRLKERVESLSNQLFAQLVSQITLFENIQRTAILYYSQVHPLSLEKFHWNIDAKGKSITEYEKAFKTIIMPVLQSIFIEKPLIFLKEGNYSYFKRFYNSYNGLPEYLSEHFPDIPDDRPYINPRQILTEDFNIVDSKSCPGVQLADMLVSVMRRPLRGNLQFKGWKDIGKLMITTFPANRAIELICLGYTELGPKNYFAIITKLERQARYPIIKH